MQMTGQVAHKRRGKWRAIAQLVARVPISLVRLYSPEGKIRWIEALARVHPDISQARCFQVRGVERLGKIADQERATACADRVQAAGMHQIDIEHQDVPGGA